MQSAYHNLPTVNGQMQGVGGRYAASDVVYRSDDSIAELSMNLAAAYPESAGIESWRRNVRLVRGDSVEINDEFVLDKDKSDVVQHLVTPCQVEVVDRGQLRLVDVTTGAEVRLEYTPPSLSVDVERIDLEDARLTENWGTRVNRVSLRTDASRKEGTWSVRISPAQ